ncbi:hypothetical protein M501DRAFT_1006079 [Patellaria atrata CBS 101060]|uniref:FYVE-type domain-containing protein n=1 Tax=Patellaria atrata CBS 101060 TaxID=1346257 RepID=A0A9P4SKJ4_9PEZI|nr:hypothetical protein M501DRAFT_1006079 [Patellaria atrata CBS 101060]
MTAEYANPPGVITPPPTFPQQYFGPGNQYAPTQHSGDSTPTRLSPTSPRSSNILPYPSRQIRPPKAPLYVPAVLRPTEKPIRNSPPKDKQDGIDGGESSSGFVGGHVSRTSTDSGYISGINRVIIDEWNPDVVGPVTGPPTREHWKLDSATPVCDLATCTKFFSFWERRHHCRRCGHIFCSQHSSHTVKLNQSAAFHPQGTLQRACDYCWSDYKKWQQERSISRSNSESSACSADSSTPTMLVRPPLLNPNPGSVQPENQKVGSFVGSLPRDWLWSTF